MKAKTKKKYRSFKWVLSVLRRMKKVGWQASFYGEHPGRVSETRKIRLAAPGERECLRFIPDSIALFLGKGEIVSLLNGDYEAVKEGARVLGLQPLTLFWLDLTGDTSNTLRAVSGRIFGRNIRQLRFSKPLWRKQLLEVLELRPDTE